MKNKPLIKNKLTRVTLSVLLLAGYGCTVQAEEQPLPPSTVLDEIRQLVNAVSIESLGEEVDMSTAEEPPEEIQTDPYCLSVDEQFPDCDD